MKFLISFPIPTTRTPIAISKSVYGIVYNADALITSIKPIIVTIIAVSFAIFTSFLLFFQGEYYLNTFSFKEKNKKFKKNYFLLVSKMAFIDTTNAAALTNDMKFPKIESI